MTVVIIGRGSFGFNIITECQNRRIHIAQVITSREEKEIIAYCGLSSIPVSFTGESVVSPAFDLGITVNSFAKVSSEMLDQARIGWIGYHPSLLPRHRGRAAIQWALKEKDVITGGTVYWLSNQMDQGDIAYQDWIFLDHSLTAREVWDKELEPIGMRLFRKALKHVKKGKIVRRPQQRLEQFATVAPRLNKVF